MDMQIVSTAAALAAACICLFFIFRKKGSGNAAAGTEQDQGDPLLYELGMNPVSEKPIMYALQTCPHCKNTRLFLQSEHIEYIEIFIDQYIGQKREDLMDKMRTYNPRGTFPTILLPGGKVIVGFRKKLIQEAMIDASGKTA